MIGWHEKKRGLHDLIAGTVVISVPSIISEMISRAELESALAEADGMQREYHGFRVHKVVPSSYLTNRIPPISLKLAV